MKKPKSANSGRRKFLKDGIEALASAALASSSLTAAVGLVPLLNSRQADAQLVNSVAWRKKRKLVLAATANSLFKSSPDGVSWSTLSTLPRVSASEAKWNDVAWNGSIYCSIGEQGALATSPTGATWTSRTSPFTNGGSRIIANGSTFLALSFGVTNLAAKSTDGITWTTVTLPFSATWVDVVWSGTKYCAVASDSDVVATSSDGTTWASGPSTASGGWHYLAWNGAAFCAVNQGGYTATSADAITWTARAAFTGLIPTGIATSGSTFYVAEVSSDIYRSVNNGATWLNSAPSVPVQPYRFAVNGSDFVIMNNTGTSHKSTDSGATWSAFSNASITSFLPSLRYLNGQYITAGWQTAARKGLATSPDGLTWTGRTMQPVLIDGQIGGAVTTPTKYCLVASNTSTTSLVSSDGVSWTKGTLPAARSWSAVAWNGGTVFCAVSGSSTNQAATSADGLVWAGQTMSASKAWVDILWNGSLFCALSGGSAPSTVASTSVDGVTWASQTLPNRQWQKLAWSGSMMVAVASVANAAASSPDGITWTSRSLPATVSLVDVVWTGSWFVAIEVGGGTVRSRDGITWTTSGQAGGAGGWAALRWNGEILIAFSDTETAHSGNHGASWASKAASPALELRFKTLLSR